MRIARRAFSLCRPRRSPNDRRAHGVLHHLAAERPELRAAAVHAELGPDADLQHDGRAQFRPRQLLHAGRLLRLHDRPARRLLAGAVHRAAAGRRARRAVRALLPAPGAQVRPRAGTAVHLRPVLPHPRAGAAGLGPRRGALPRAAAACRVRCSRCTARSFPTYRGLHDAGGAADAASRSGCC